MKSAFKKLPSGKHSIDGGLLFAVTLCAAISTLLIYSITYNKVLETVGSSYWKTQAFSMGVGIVAAIVISFIDYRKLVKLWVIFVPLSLGLMALTFTSLGYRREGADDQAWLNLGFIQFQPSEVLKMAFILTFAYHLSRDEEEMNKPLHMLLIIIHGMIPLGIVGMQGDYGTAIVFAAIFAFMICSAKISWKYLVAAPFVIAAGVAGMWFFSLPSDGGASSTRSVSSYFSTRVQTPSTSSTSRTSVWRLLNRAESSARDFSASLTIISPFPRYTTTSFLPMQVRSSALSALWDLLSYSPISALKYSATAAFAATIWENSSVWVHSDLSLPTV